MRHGSDDNDSSEAISEVAKLLRRAAALLEAVAGPSIAQTRDAAISQHSNNPPPIEERLTSRQLGAVFAIGRRRGLARDRIQDLVHERTGKSRVEHLTREEASAIIGELDARNGTHP